MTEDRLSELLNNAVPPLGPALSGEVVLAKARRRQSLRRRGTILLSAVAVVAGVAGVAFAVQPDDKSTTVPIVEPCISSSPFADTATEPSVAFPQEGRTARISVEVNDHFTVGWSGCGEFGEITTDGPRDSSESVISASDVSSTGPRSVPYGVTLPPSQGSGVYEVRYSAQREGTVTLHGKGNKGSDGYIEVTVRPIPGSDSRRLTGVVDTSGLINEPGPTKVAFQKTIGFDGITYADVVDGTFSVRLRPGTYQVLGQNEAYNNGRASCVGTVTVADVDLDNGLVLHCTEKPGTHASGSPLVPPDPGGPAAGACAEPTTDVATVILNPDTPMPRCTKIRPGQKLRIVNGSNNFGQTGAEMTITLRGYSAVTLQPGEGHTYDQPLSEVLAPGYHRTGGGLYGDAELLVE